MSLITAPTTFRTTSLDYYHYPNRPKSGRKQVQDLPLSKKSIPNLLQFVRDPFGNVGVAVEDWLDGSTKEERAKQQVVEDRKQLLYLKMRTVSVPSSSLINRDVMADGAIGNYIQRLGGGSNRT